LHNIESKLQRFSIAVEILQRKNVGFAGPILQRAANLIRIAGTKSKTGYCTHFLMTD
jgi:hypothetical protein